MEKLNQSDFGKHYKSFQLSKEDEAIFLEIMRLPKNKAKMFAFAHKNKITNDDVDYYMSISPKKQETESYDDYKSRVLFQNHLLKYRKHIYNYYQNSFIKS